MTRDGIDLERIKRGEQRAIGVIAWTVTGVAVIAAIMLVM